MKKKIDNELLKNNKVICKKNNNLRIVAWEVTKNCNLFCRHCRASSKNKRYNNELDTISSLNFLDELAKEIKPVVILTGGEPLLRKDIFDIASYGTSLDLRMVMATNGTLITKKTVNKILESGIKRVSISIDGYDSVSHDSFRGVEGSFKMARLGIEILKKSGIDFQINTTITKSNFLHINKILTFVEKIGAIAHHIFFLVPTGRGKYCIDDNIDKEEYEELLNWFYIKKKNTKLELKVTCAPQYYRVMRQMAIKENVNINFENYGRESLTRGCLSGIGFCFVSYSGVVKPCGYTNAKCGNIIDNNFISIWRKTSILTKLRNYKELKGKCSLCKYFKNCGGCRARSFEITSDYMGEDSFCSYKSRTQKKL